MVPERRALRRCCREEVSGATSSRQRRQGLAGITATAWRAASYDRTTYTGQFGLLVVESGREPGAYDLDVPIVLHEWDARLTREGPLDVEYRYQSINGRMLGAGEPVRVRQGQRVLFRILNASATLTHRLALPGHLFHVNALDGYPVPNPRSVPIVEVAPGERVDAIVTMDRPGIWTLG